MNKISRSGTIGGLAVTAVAIWTVLQLSPLLAYSRMRDFAWRRTASPKELRETAHAALGLWGGDPHEALVILCAVGDRSSIPHLKRALANGPKATDDGVECTWSHGQDALDRIQAGAQRGGAPTR